MLTVLSLNGTSLIPKTYLNSTISARSFIPDLGPDVVRIEELEALGERHLGCGHEI